MIKSTLLRLNNGVVIIGCASDPSQDLSSSTGDVETHVIATSGVLLGESMMLHFTRNPVVTPEPGGVRVQDHLVGARLPDSDLVVREALVSVKVEDEQDTASFEDHHLVRLVLPRNVSGMSRKPSILFLHPEECKGMKRNMNKESS